MTATIESVAISHGELMDELLRDPEFRETWEASTFARLVANQVIRYRIDHGLSQRKLAALLGMHSSQVARLEAGEHEPRLSTLQLLTRRLGLCFRIDIHPVGRPPAARIDQRHNQTQRVTADGVETLVSASC